MAKDHPETNPITIKPKTVSHEAEQFSWVPLPSCSPPGCPFPIKPLALSAHVSPWTILFRVLDKSLLFGPCRGPPPSYNRPALGRTLWTYRAYLHVQWPVDCTSWSHFSIRKKKQIQVSFPVYQTRRLLLSRGDRRKQKPLLGCRVRGQKYARMNPTS